MFQLPSNTNSNNCTLVKIFKKLAHLLTKNSFLEIQKHRVQICVNHFQSSGNRSITGTFFSSINISSSYFILFAVFPAVVQTDGPAQSLLTVVGRWRAPRLGRRPRLTDRRSAYARTSAGSRMLQRSVARGYRSQ